MNEGGSMEERLLEQYLRQAERVELGDFLDFVYGVLFTAYVNRTAMETQKTYYLKDRIRRGYVTYLEDAPDRGSFLCQENGDPVADQVLDKILAEAVEELPDKQRDVLKAFYLEEKDERRIARERGISRQAVNGLKRRGLAALRLHYFAELDLEERRRYE